MEQKQYSRHFLIPELGALGQEKLKTAKVLVVGAGGLGCPILQYLTAAGIGNIGILDGDLVCQSNLQRQILYTVNDLGKLKTEAAKSRLEILNPYISIRIFSEFLDVHNAIDIFNQFDIIVDACDNFSTRYLINDAAILANKPVVFGSVFGFEGQTAVFNYKNGGTYRCLFPNPPTNIPEKFGVLGVLPGIIGCLQATEIIKIVCELENILSSKLLSYHLLTNKQRVFSFKRTERARIINLKNSYN